MNQIKFTSGQLTRFTPEYYTLVLFNGTKQVYKATIPTAEAAKLAFKSKKITISSAIN